MKKLLSVLLAVFMMASLVACGADEPTNTDTPTTDETTTAIAKVGVGSVTSVSASSVSADAETGTYQVNTTYAVVALDGEGKIVTIDFDVAQNKGTVDGTGAVAVTEEFPTKDEKKEDYNMKSASPIGKEWYEQIEAYEAWCVGKTVAEVLAVETDPEAHNAPKVEELTSSCTMNVLDFMAALEKANNNAQEVTGAVKVGLASVTNASASSASADADASIQFNTTYAAVALDAEGKLVYVDIDVAQNSAKYDATGVTTLVAEEADTRTKNEKKEDYNMKSASPIGKEWYEQTDAFEAWCVGKTAAEVAAVETDPEAHNAPKVEELASSCTMNVVDFMAAIAEAAEESK